MTKLRETLFAAAGLTVLVVGWLAWGRRVHGVGLPFLAILLLSTMLLGAAVVRAERSRGAWYAVIGAVAFLAAALDPSTGYDERNGYCFLLGAAFAVAAGVRAYPSGRDEGALAAAAWTSSFVLLAGVVSFLVVTIVVLWAAGG